MVCAAINQIETSNVIWTGSIGGSSHSDNCSWNILIRTLEAKKIESNGMELLVGGITIRSEATMEVAESVWKSQAIRKAVVG